MIGRIKDSIFYNGVVSNPSATSVYECRNALDSTLLWVRVCNSAGEPAFFSLHIRPSNAAASWVASQANSVFFEEQIASNSSMEKKVWIPLHDGDKVYVLSSVAGTTTFISGYQRTTT